MINNKQWSKEEELIVTNFVIQSGHNWKECSKLINKTPKQIREKWVNTINPTNIKGDWKCTEDYIIFKLYDKIGSKWAYISTFLPGRSQNSLKNRFYTTLRKIALYKHYDSTKAKIVIKTQINDLLIYFSEAYSNVTKKIDNILDSLSISEENAFNIDLLNEIVFSQEENINSLKSN